ncbi:hypothetical protein HDC92_002494 [Pedobacter sp. AK017]|uniref:hypothetical protein n=1 Tax=Pedobacter sp. AK017 TaxID=2723073 RepID=UPI00161334A5|nr:hypothetical protein [Pedobacter sp. AK017]MBB5438813.1 hypothetical protein [Pedobacter sp. AK017]
MMMKVLKENTDILPAKELDDFFAVAGMHIKTKEEVYLELHETGQVIATCPLSFDEKKGISIDLLADYDNVEQLIKVHGIKRTEDLNRITQSDLWLRYLGGNGYVAADINELDAELCFRIVKSVTMVYSADMNFYQEIIHVMSMKHQFERYIDENMHRFAVAVLMRPMLLPEKLYVP